MQLSSDIKKFIELVIRASKNTGVVTPFIFIVLYWAANQLYVTYHLPGLIGTQAALFVTSPFNGLEDLSKIYGSLWSGLLNNYVVVAIVLWLAEIYAVHFSIKLKAHSPYIIFLCSVLATYVLAALVWVATGQPSAGSSIIGFSITGFLLASLLLDAKHYILSGLQRIKSSVFSVRGWLGYLLAIMSPILTAFLLATYLISNQSWWLHLLGGGIFLLIILVSSYLVGWWKERKVTELLDSLEKASEGAAEP